MYKTIIWATDGSVSTERLFPVVKELVEDNDAKLIVAHVQNHLMIGRRPIFDDSHRALDAVLQKTVDDLIRDGFDAELALTDSLGVHPAQVMADLAQETGADLIIAGSQSQGPVAGLFLGGFTNALLQVAPCPVLVVPRKQHSRTDTHR